MRIFLDDNYNEIYRDPLDTAQRVAVDTCDCIMIYRPNGTWLFTQQKCRLHAALNGQALLDAVFAHCRSFNYAAINPMLTDKENADIINVNKLAEKQRIRTL